jgi:hypothetical protein
MTRPFTMTLRGALAPTCAALALLLSACTSTGGSKSAGEDADASPTAKLEQRALERWKLLIGKQPDKAWEFLSPGVRSTWTREKYAAEMSQRPVQWEKVQNHGETVCEAEDACLVKLLVTYSMDVPLPNVGRVTSPAVLEEKWIALDGVWYHVPADFSRK